METYKEPPQELLEEIFQEIREGRSKKSAVKYLRQKGYTISETVLRHRYEVWLSYRQAVEDFEKRLNQLKGEFKSKFQKQEKFEREAKKKINEIIRALWNNPSTEEEGKFGELLRLWWEVNDLQEENKLLKKKISTLEGKISSLEEENKRLKREISIVAKAIYSIFVGLSHQGLTEKAWSAIRNPEKGNLKQFVIDAIEKLSNR
jgi:FtsZ-binding cell division protein ZapB